MEKELYQPKMLQEAIKYFSDVDVCLNYLISRRWPNGITCRNCEGREPKYPDINSGMF